MWNLLYLNLNITTLDKNLYIFNHATFEQKKKIVITAKSLIYLENFFLNLKFNKHKMDIKKKYSIQQ